MKTLVTFLLASASFIAVAEDTYRPPVRLTAAEAVQARAALQKNHSLHSKHEQARLAIAKENNKKLAKPGMPLQKPYYGDFAANGHSGHH